MAWIPYQFRNYDQDNRSSWNYRPWPTNQDMVNALQESGSLQSEVCIAAFEAVDRGHFWPLKNGVHDGVCYLDGPLRHGRLHLSAPSIYAQSLEALDLKPGLSFLNIGSGTGYFSAVVSELIGSCAVSHGIDICEEHVRRAGARCQRIGKHGIEFFHGNIYNIDVKKSMRYDRIYIGACCKKESKYLIRLLKVGGILVGPFKTRRGNQQKLRKIVRLEENYFESEILETVFFASLVEPLRDFEGTVETTRTRPIVASTKGFQIGDPDNLGLPGVPFTFSLNQEIWSPEKTPVYPESFQRVIRSVARLGPQAGALPVELWREFILPWTPKFWFEPEHPSLLKRTKRAECQLSSKSPTITQDSEPSEEERIPNDESDDASDSNSNQCMRPFSPPIEKSSLPGNMEVVASKPGLKDLSPEFSEDFDGGTKQTNCA